MIPHGLIHFIGFAKAFGYRSIPMLTKEISRPAGALWFITAILFIAAPVIMLTNDTGWIIALAAVIISQLLIILSWQDSKYGTIVNLLILAALAAVFIYR